MFTPNAVVLVVTSSQDSTADYLLERVPQAPATFVRFDTELYPQEWSLDWHIHPPKAPELKRNEDIVPCASVVSVWYRRPAPPRIAGSVVERHARDFAQKECEVALAALWQDFDVLWINHPSAIRSAIRKPHQLCTAREVGFAVPDTLLTSRPEKVQSFWERHEGEVVFKPLHQDAIEINDCFYFAYTARLTREHLRELEKVAYAPALFQQYIQPMAEVRVTVVGRKVFAAVIASSDIGPGPDWRRLHPDAQRWQPHTLPIEIEQRCVRLVRRHNLHFGAIDLLLTRSQEYIFLDLNASGQWVWIELITGLPISQALIDLLCSPVTQDDCHLRSCPSSSVR